MQTTPAGPSVMCGRELPVRKRARRSLNAFAASILNSSVGSLLLKALHNRCIAQSGNESTVCK